MSAENLLTTIQGDDPDSQLDNFPPIGSFQAVPSLVLKDLRRRNDKGKRCLQHIDVAVYALLKSHSRMKGECHPSIERLAKLAACSVSTIQRSLKRLEDAGHIQRKNNTRGKIFLLTDVSAKGKIIQKKRICFGVVPRLVPSVRPQNLSSITSPAIQDILNAASPLPAVSESETLQEDDSPF
jgi:DNA-binding transcriptional regulator YhcF (GntR family)